MQETQLLLVQGQTLIAAIAFQVVAVFGLGLAWLSVLRGASDLADRRSAFTRVAALARALGILWLVVLVTAWPPLLERTGNVLGPMLLAVVLALLVTEGLVWRLAQGKHAKARQVAGVCVALAYTAALLLVVLAQSWLAKPAGATLIDGRFQVALWADVLHHTGFMSAALATVLAGVVFSAAWVQSGASWLPGTDSQRPSSGFRAVLTALAVASLVGLLWLVTRSWPASTPFEVTLMQGGFDTVNAVVVRATFVLWLLTIAGLLVGLMDRPSMHANQPAGSLKSFVRRAPVITAPLLWVLAWWQINGRDPQATLADLPVADLVSTQPVWVLAFGCALVATMVVIAAWSLRRCFVGAVVAQREGAA